jgi:C-terminal processing protease CtpA/Prc
MKGLILDFRDHTGGTMWPLLFALSRFLNNTSLYAWSNKKVTKNDKKWDNLINGQIKMNQHYISESDNKINIPIAVLIGENTDSSGEFVASCFIARDNVKLFGNKTSGNLSVNNTYFYDKYVLSIPELLQTSRNLEFKEYIEPDIYTTHPIRDAKKFIKSLI